MAHNGEYFATQGDTSCICVSVSYMVAFSCTTGLYWCVFSTQNCHRSGVYWSFSLYILVCDWCVFILVCDWCVLVFFSVHTGVWLMCTVFSPQYILVCDWCVHFFCTYWCVTDVYCFFPYILVCDWRVLVFFPLLYILVCDWCVLVFVLFSQWTQAKTTSGWEQSCTSVCWRQSCRTLMKTCKV